MEPFFFHENNPWCKRGNLATCDKLNDIQSITSYPFSLLVDHLQFLVVLLDYGAIDVDWLGMSTGLRIGQPAVANAFFGFGDSQSCVCTLKC